MPIGLAGGQKPPDWIRKELLYLINMWEQTTIMLEQLLIKTKQL